MSLKRPLSATQEGTSAAARSLSLLAAKGPLPLRSGVEEAATGIHWWKALRRGRARWHSPRAIARSLRAPGKAKCAESGRAQAPRAQRDCQHNDSRTRMLLGTASAVRYF